MEYETPPNYIFGHVLPLDFQVYKEILPICSVKYQPSEHTVDVLHLSKISPRYLRKISFYHCEQCSMLGQKTRFIEILRDG